MNKFFFKYIIWKHIDQQIENIISIIYEIKLNLMETLKFQYKITSD